MYGNPCTLRCRFDEAWCPAYLLSEVGPGQQMHYVYLLQSLADPDQSYVGYSSDLRTRLRAHNAGSGLHTSKYRPWKLVTYIAFTDKPQALNFERYLKSHSGKAFGRKRLWAPSSAPSERHPRTARN
jgi:putative endonuclease